MSKMEDVLQKDDRFTLDPRQELSVNLSRVLSKLCRMKSIDEKEKFHLLSSGIAIPRLGGSPEIHKDHLRTPDHPHNSKHSYPSHLPLDCRIA